MSDIVFFIDNEYSNYLVASRSIKQYSSDDVTKHSNNTMLSGNIILAKSELIGLTDNIISDFINKKANKEILVGTLNNTACIIGVNGDLINNFFPNKELIFEVIEDQWSRYDLNFYPLKLINNIAKLIEFEQEMQDKLRQNALNQGVFLQDPASIYLSFNTKFGNRVIVEPHVYFGSDVEIGDNVHIKAFSYLEGVQIENGVSIGPFARIRANSIIRNNAKIGNFVEIKNSELDSGTKINHLSYIGDAEIGKNVNIGAGVITCNYDGLKKNKTKIKNDTFVGANSVLIAPITIGAKSLIGAGSFINKDVPDDSFAIGRSKQQIKPNRRK